MKYKCNNKILIQKAFYTYKKFSIEDPSPTLIIFRNENISQKTGFFEWKVGWWWLLFTGIQFQNALFVAMKLALNKLFFLCIIKQDRPILLYLFICFLWHANEPFMYAKNSCIQFTCTMKNVQTKAAGSCLRISITKVNFFIR